MIAVLLLVSWDKQGRFIFWFIDVIPNQSLLLNSCDKSGVYLAVNLVQRTTKGFRLSRCWIVSWHKSGLAGRNACLSSAHKELIFCVQKSSTTWTNLKLMVTIFKLVHVLWTYYLYIWIYMLQYLLREGDERVSEVKEGMLLTVRNEV